MRPRRNRSNANLVQQQQRMHPHVESHSTGMTPASRYDSNLKVLRRRDSSIVSIFDQFSHVCVYHHNGKKWEKQGFEGSMFLYEWYQLCRLSIQPLSLTLPLVIHIRHTDSLY